MELEDLPDGDGRQSRAFYSLASKTDILGRIFIIEGAVTVFISLFVWIILPDSPSTAKFLTADEREFLIARLDRDTASGHGRVTNNDKVSRRQIWAGLTEWEVWAGVVRYQI
jgi:hypothetical protein